MLEGYKIPLEMLVVAVLCSIRRGRTFEVVEVLGDDMDRIYIFTYYIIVAVS